MNLNLFIALNLKSSWLNFLTLLEEFCLNFTIKTLIKLKFESTIMIDI